MYLFDLDFFVVEDGKDSGLTQSWLLKACWRVEIEHNPH